MTMKKFLNNFLNKKTDFIEDDQLRSLNEQFYFILNEEKKLLNKVIKQNIKYFFKYKKTYLVKLFLRITVACGLVIGFIAGGLFVLDYLNIVHISKAIPKEKIVIYLPDGDSNIEKLSKTYNVKIFFPYDEKKDWKEFKSRVQYIESHGLSDSSSYSACNGQYWGRYQLGYQARKLSGLGDISFKDFSTNPQLQEGVFLAWIRFIRMAMASEINKYCGKYIDGIEITESGIIAMTHNAGSGAVRSYLQRGGGNPPGGLRFLKIGGYNLNLN